MPIINDYFLTSKTSRPGTKLLSVEAIVVHWTANTKPGANAKANANYFNNSGVQASSQFIVDSTGIYRLMEDDEVAYHCGGKSYKSIGESLKIDGKSPNYSTIGIEMCVNSDGDFAKTEKFTIELINYLLDKFKLSINDVVRHYDITGKDCPNMYIAEDKWSTFKSKLTSKYKWDHRIITASSLNVRDKPTTDGSKVVGSLANGLRVRVLEDLGEWVRIRQGYVSSKYLKR